jgi:DNA-binding Xre family transcriptional regulator
MTDEQFRAIHAGYMRGEQSIRAGAEAIGFSRATAVLRIRELGLTMPRSRARLKLVGSAAQAEQRLITELLVARIDVLRESRELSVARLAHVSGLSLASLEHVRHRRRDPRLTTVLKLCQGLDVSPGELLDDLPLPVETRPRRTGPPTRANSRVVSGAV